MSHDDDHDEPPEGWPERVIMSRGSLWLLSIAANARRRPYRMIGRAVGCALLSVGAFVLLASILVASYLFIGAFVACMVGYCPWYTATPSQQARALGIIHVFGATFGGVAVGMVLVIRVTMPEARRHCLMRTIVAGLIALAVLATAVWLWFVLLFI